MLSYPFTFPKIKGTLLGRLNRFVVEVEMASRREKAYLPNTGRLWELLLPGTALLLSPASSGGKLPYTVLACEKEGRYVLLHTHLTNKIVRRLIDEGRLPPYQSYRVIDSEPAYGKHRFDLLLEHRRSGELLYLEIKNNTLFESRTAMFPGAVTKRGARHLRLLAELSRENRKGSCLFAIMNPRVEYFIPAFHIDYRFAQTFLEVRDTVQLNALALDFDPSFTAVTAVKPVAIPYGFIAEEMQDRGVYLLLLQLKESKTVLLPGERRLTLEEGYYVYLDRAPENLGREAARHRQKRKKKRQPIDYLTAAAAAVTAVPIISGENLAPELAARLKMLSGGRFEIDVFPGSKGSGSLFYFAENPLHNRNFIELIQRYRIVRLEQKLTAGSFPSRAD